MEFLSGKHRALAPSRALSVVSSNTKCRKSSVVETRSRKIRLFAENFNSPVT